MIRGEYLIRELNQSVLNVVTQKKIGKYLEELCQLYADELVWYRFSELTITEANVLQGTRTQLEDQHPLFGLRGLRRLLEFSDEFLAELKVMVSVYQSHHNLCVFLPFVNDARFRNGFEDIDINELLQIMVWTFKVSKIKFTYPAKLQIIIHEDLLKKVNLYELKENE